MVFITRRQMQEEESHPLFVQMYTRASYIILVLSFVQWPSFFLAAFVFYQQPGK